MKTKSISFFASGNDLSALLEAVCMDTPFDAYVFRKGFKSPQKDESIFAKDMIRTTDEITSNQLDSILLIDRDGAPETRVVNSKRGEEVVFFDQKSMPESVVIKLGGMNEEKGVLLAGQLGTITENEWSESLYKKLSKSMKRDFSKVGAFFVSDQALELAKLGVRLTVNARAPLEFDLKIDNEGME